MQRKLFNGGGKGALIEDDNARWEHTKYQWLRSKYKDLIGVETIDRIYFKDANCNFREAQEMLKRAVKGMPEQLRLLLDEKDRI